jgi:hypothetical protein
VKRWAMPCLFWDGSAENLGDLDWIRTRLKESDEDDRGLVQNGPCPPCPKSSLVQVVPLQNYGKTGMHERILAEE